MAPTSKRAKSKLPGGVFGGFGPPFLASAAEWIGGPENRGVPKRGVKKGSKRGSRDPPSQGAILGSFLTPFWGYGDPLPGRGHFGVVFGHFWGPGPKIEKFDDFFEKMSLF